MQYFEDPLDIMFLLTHFISEMTEVRILGFFFKKDPLQRDCL